MNQLKSKITRKFRNLGNQFNSKIWPDKSIVFYAGTTPYPHYDWSPLDLKTGLGGSELAVINLAREWVKLGYQVTVYNSCSQAEGIYEGVTYLHHSKFNQYDTFDTLIIWRYPWILYPKTKANRIWLELQEMLLPEQVTEDKLAKFDKIFVRSQYHQTILPKIEDARICLLPNGVESNYAAWRDNPKAPYKLIYASSYNRGLERMLTYGWPIIKREIPQATLYIYYGFPAIKHPTSDDENIIGTPAWVRKMKKSMEQPGIIECGRIGVDELVREKSTSTIHYYACTFQETDCISVRESALVGCVPVTTDYAALAEKDYCIKVPGNPYQQETQELVAGKIVEFLKKPEQLQNLRRQFQEIAKHETWENIASAWLANITSQSN